MSAAQKKIQHSQPRSLSRSQAGFSLIELMVVVAIIAVLATIAIPRVNRFVAKSRTSEAQINLSSIYTFNKNFYVEYQGYTNSFPSMGYVPEGRIRYNVGWSSVAECPIGFTGTGRTCDEPTSSAVYCGVLSGSATAAGSVTGEGCDLLPGPGDTTEAAISTDALALSTFTAIATAKLIDSASGEADTWRINQDKNLDNVNDGTDGL